MLFPLFATGVVGTGGINNSSGTGGKFAAGVIDTRANSPREPVANLPPVLLILLVLLHLRISLRIVEKI
jgi:hypothetical protein